MTLTQNNRFFGRLKKILLPSIFLLTLSYLVCLFFIPSPGVRFGLVFGFVLGQFNIWMMVALIGKLLNSRSGRKTAILATLLMLKVVALFGLMWLGFRLWNLNLLALAAGYLQVLFLVVLGLSFGYKPARLET